MSLALDRRILETAREITRQALPIKCVEAVFLATYLTQGLRELERVPVSFKSQVDGNTYKHIILAVKHNSKWGAVGLSRPNPNPNPNPTLTRTLTPTLTPTRWG